MTVTDKETIGVVLLNLGGPDSLQAVKPFLYNLFSDRDIIRLGPSFMQKPMAWLISTFRLPKTRRMYSLIGNKSPIIDITKAQAEALENSLNLYDTEKRRHGKTESHDFTESPSHRVTGSQFKVYIGMRYWHPFIKDTVDKILSDGIKHLIVLTLYPHYSKATTGSAVAEFKEALSSCRLQASSYKIQYIEQWYDFPPYIDALTELIYKDISEFKKDDFDILYSAHSLPECFIKEGDPYLDHIKATITAVNLLLATTRLSSSTLSSLPKGSPKSRYSLPCRWHLSFQSKTGPVKWLQPSTDETIIRLANEGCKNLFVVPISFVSDHIETLYEIDILYKELAERHGMNFKRCEALNTSEKFIKALKELVMRETQVSTEYL